MSSSIWPGGPITALTLTIASPEVKDGEHHFDGASGDTEAICITVAKMEIVAPSQIAVGDLAKVVTIKAA